MIALIELLRIEPLVETAFCEILNKHGGQAVPEFSDQEPQGPVSEVKLINVAEQRTFRYHGRLVPYEWSAQLVVTHVTKRFKDSSEQAAMAGRTRYVRFHFIELFAPLLPHHIMTWMREISADPTHQPEGQLDQREQQFEIKIEIREEIREELLPAGD